MNHVVHADANSQRGIFFRVVKDNGEEVAKDNQWFTEHIIAKGDTITIKVNDKVVTEWTQPADWQGAKTFPDRRIGLGTIALQGHDHIRIKPLK